MAKTVKAVKKGAQATRIKKGALNTFTTAKDSVLKANELLDSAIALEENTLVALEKQIADLYTEMDAVQARKLALQAEKGTNVALIANLEKFAG